MRFFSIYFRLTMFSLLLFAAAACGANEFKEKSLEQKVLESDLVVMGTIGEPVRCAVSGDGGCSPSMVTVKFHISKTLKGGERSEILFRCNESVNEESPDACNFMGRYILFLWRDLNGVYHSVNGVYGAYQLNGANGI